MTYTISTLQKPIEAIHFITRNFPRTQQNSTRHHQRATIDRIDSRTDSHTWQCHLFHSFLRLSPSLYHHRNRESTSCPGTHHQHHRPSTVRYSYEKCKWQFNLSSFPIFDGEPYCILTTEKSQDKKMVKLPAQQLYFLDSANIHTNGHVRDLNLFAVSLQIDFVACSLFPWQGRSFTVCPLRKAKERSWLPVTSSRRGVIDTQVTSTNHC